MTVRILLICSVVSVVWLTGCDQQARQEARARRQLHEALEWVEKAEVGYVPAGEDQVLPPEAPPGQDPAGTQPAVGDALGRADLQEYRQDELQEALAKLQPVIQSGSPHQSRRALAVAADIHASAARRIRRAAATDWTGLSNRSAVLVSYTVAVGRARSRLQSLETDDAALYLKLQDDQRTWRGNLEELKKTAAGLDSQIARRQAAIEQLNTQVEQARAKARELKDQAFPLEGDRRWDLYDQAAEFDRTAFTTSSKAQREAIQIEVLQSERAIETEKIEFAQSFIQSLEQQIQDLASRQAEIQQQRRKAEEELKAIEQKLVDAVTEWIKAYTTDVSAPLQQAAAEMEKGIDLLIEAVKGARGEEKRALESDLLAKYLDKINILQTHVVAASDMGGKIRIIVQRAESIMPDRTEFFRGMLQQLASEQVQVINDAKKTIADAIALAGSLGQGAAADDPITVAATQQREQLDRYNTRIEEARLSAN